MARPLKPLVKSGGYYPTNKWTPLVYQGGRTTRGGGEEPTPEVWKTASGAIASFETQIAWPLRKLLTNIDPIQDLHGYDSPWPAGGGKNLLDPDKRTNLPGNIYYYYEDGFLLKAGQTYTLSVSGENAAGLYFVRKSDGTNLASKYNTTAMTYTVTEDTLVYTSAYYSPNPSGGTADINCQLEIGSSATSWTPYSNLCPISGRTGCEVSHTGKNLFDEQYPGIKSTSVYKQIFVGDGNFTLSTTTPLNTQSAPNLFFLPGAVSSGAHSQNNGVSVGAPRTVTSVDGYVTIAYRNANDVSPEDYKTQLELGSTATAYESFGETIPISWQTEAGTVYGGNDKIVSGELSSNMVSVDLGSFTWYSTGVAGEFSTTRPSDCKPGVTAEKSNILCSKYKTSARSGQPDMAISLTPSFIIVTDSSAADAQSFNNGIQGVQLVYELAQPQTYQLDPVTVQTLLGQNNIFADCGDVEVEYRES